MSEQSVIAVRRYNQAFHNVHGRLPDVRINHGWIRVNNSPKSFRPAEILEMADNLDRRAREEPRPNRIIAEMAEARINERDRELDERRQIIMRLRNDILAEHEHENSVWDVRDELNARVQAQIQNEVKEVVLDNNNESGVPLTGWKKTIRKDTMVMFFNRLFEKAGHSAHVMQRMMDHFVHTGQFGEEPDCEDCGMQEELQEELEYINDKLSDMRRERDHYRENISTKSIEIKKLKDKILKSDKQMNELKKNSILFSMDEF